MTGISSDDAVLALFAIAAFVVVALRLIEAYQEIRELELRGPSKVFDQGGAQRRIAESEAERARARAS